MKKSYTKPQTELYNCEARLPLAASISFETGETNTMYAPEFNSVISGWEE